MRYTEPVQFKLKGDGAKKYISQARTFLGKMLEIFSDSPDGQNWKTVLPDGTQFSAYLPAKGMIPIVTISSEIKEIELPEYKEESVYLLFAQRDPSITPAPVLHDVYQIDGPTGEVIRIGGLWDGLIPDDAGINGGFSVYNNNFYININPDNTIAYIYKNNTLLKTVSSVEQSLGMTDLYYILGYRYDSTTWAYDIRDHNIDIVPAIPSWGVLDAYEITYGGEHTLINKHGISMHRKDSSYNFFAEQFTIDGTPISTIPIRIWGSSHSISSNHNTGGCGRDFWAAVDEYNNYIIINHLGEKVSNIDLTDLVVDLDNYSNNYIRIAIGFSSKFMFMTYSIGKWNDPPPNFSYPDYTTVDLFIYSYTLTKDSSGKITDFTLNQNLLSPLHKKRLYDNAFFIQTSQIEPDRISWYST